MKPVAPVGVARRSAVLGGARPALRRRGRWVAAERWRRRRAAPTQSRQLPAGALSRRPVCSSVAWPAAARLPRGAERAADPARAWRAVSGPRRRAREARSLSWSRAAYAASRREVGESRRSRTARCRVDAVGGRRTPTLDAGGGELPVARRAASACDRPAAGRRDFARASAAAGSTAGRAERRRRGPARHHRAVRLDRRLDLAPRSERARPAACSALRGATGRRPLAPRASPAAVRRIGRSARGPARDAVTGYAPAPQPAGRAELVWTAAPRRGSRVRLAAPCLARHRRRARGAAPPSRRDSRRRSRRRRRSSPMSNALVDEVMRRLDRRFRIERQRRGL